MDNDEFTTCPYDATHRVPRSRMQHHLIKCEKVNPKLWICPFNATHRFPDHLKSQHYITCPDKVHDVPKYLAKSANTGTIGAITTPKPLLQKDYLPENDPENEYWD